MGAKRTVTEKTGERERVMKPDFTATKGRQAQNEKRGGDAVEARQGAGYRLGGDTQRRLWAEENLQ